MSEFMDPLQRREPEDLEARFFEDGVNIGGKSFFYLTIPYPGCTKAIPCEFCAFAGTGIPGLKVDERLGRTVVQKVQQGLARHSDTLVLLNNGNILNSNEMYPPAILEHVPQVVACHPSCRALEIEVSVKDLLSDSIWEKLRTIRQNLAGKELRVRVAVEYADDALLARHRKGTNMADVGSAIGALSAEGIPWIGYALLGGMEMTSEEAQRAAIQTGQYIMDRGARMLSVNGLFLTEGMRKTQMQTGRQVYLPSIDDLIKVLRALTAHGALKGAKPLIKIGLAEEDGGLKIVEYPYCLPADDSGIRQRMIGILRDFNGDQKYETFFIGVMQNWAKTEAFRKIR